MKHAGSICLCIVIASASAAVASSVDSLVSWAEHIAPQAVNRVDSDTPTKVDDHFGVLPYSRWRGPRDQEGLAAHGMDLPTAGSGSTWVFDPVHRIAAETSAGDETGDQIMYAAPPPSTIPARDLTRVVSSHGLKLGMSPAQAAHDLDVAASAVRRVDAHYSYVSTNDLAQHNGVQLGHYATIVFRDGRAVYISLGDAGP